GIRDDLVTGVQTCALPISTVYRYRTDDGLPGFEGGFHLCASWLVDAYLLAGRVDDALDLFRQLVTLAGPTGLLSEQYDPAQERRSEERRVGTGGRARAWAV